jgi:hypothetical protein
MNTQNRIKQSWLNFCLSFFNYFRFLFRLLSTEGRLNIFLDYATNKIQKVQGNIIKSGPFCGMKYVGKSVGSALIPKLIGSYEEELHELFMHLYKAKCYTTIVDIGCAEGYYAIGLALNYLDAYVFAFDINDDAKFLCAQMAKINGVAHRVFIAGECNEYNLKKLVTHNTLLIVDCEGAEYDLLDPLKTPQLLSADLLIELHDFMDPRITPAIVERFRASHAITMYTARQRDISKYPELISHFGFKKASFLIKERDLIGQQWAFLEKKEIENKGSSAKFVGKNP